MNKSSGQNFAIQTSAYIMVAYVLRFSKCRFVYSNCIVRSKYVS